MRIYDKTVCFDMDGCTLAEFLMSEMNISKCALSDLKGKHCFLVNGECVRLRSVLNAGDIVTVFFPELLTNDLIKAEEGNINIVYQDDDLMIIDKPAPMVVQVNENVTAGTLENYLKYHFRENPEFIFRPVNRLDAGTSGILGAAFHSQAHYLLQMQLHTRSYIREYLAVVEGVTKPCGTVNMPILKVDPVTYRRWIDYPSGAPSVTHYRRIGTDGKRSLIRLRLESGRTHQIRVHMAAIGHPVTGDYLYGDTVEELPERFALHSTYIRLTHPYTGKTLEFFSPLPESIRALVQPDDAYVDPDRFDPDEFFSRFR